MVAGNLGPILCGGSKDPKNPFGERCRNKATWRTPMHPLCDECAKQAMDSIRSGETLLNVIAEIKGISTDTILSKFVRIAKDGE